MKLFASAVAVLSLFAMSAVVASPSAGLEGVLSSRKFGALLKKGKRSFPTNSFVAATNSTDAEDDDYDDDDEGCDAEIGAFMTCLPDCASGCIFKSSLGTDWEDCASIEAHFATATACVDASDEKCEAEAAEMMACYNITEEEAAEPCAGRLEAGEGRARGPLVAATNSTDAEDDDYDYDEDEGCIAEEAAFMRCLPDCASGCIFKSFLGVDWDDCASIETHVATATACIDASEEKCEAEQAAMIACYNITEEEAADPCAERLEAGEGRIAALRGAVE